MGKPPFEIQCGERIASYSDEGPFLATLDSFTQLGMNFSVSIAIVALPVIDKINEVLIRRGVHAKILADQSDEQTLDYLASVTAGGLAGGTLGGLVGLLTLLAARAPVVPYIGVPVAVLAGVGALAGWLATRKGFSITAYLKEDRLQIQFDPIPPPLAA